MRPSFPILASLALALALGALALSCRPRQPRPDPFVGLWEFWENGVGERKRYLSITKTGEVYEALRADSVHAELAAAARGRGAGSGGARRIELAFPDGERFILRMNGSNELVVSFERPLQPEDITFSYFRSAAERAEPGPE